MGLFDKIFNSDKKENKDTKLSWKTLDSLEGLEAAIKRSFEVPVVLFKHSTRCSISSMALHRLERAWNFAEGQEPEMYYLDLIAFRPVSAAIAEQLKVYHESPQLILVKNGEAIYDASHNDITIDELREALQQ
jgi:bacillithiol system protein YtxJ